MSSRNLLHQRRYQKTEEGRATNRKAQVKWAHTNRHKTRAHSAVQRAVKRGDLVRPDTCGQCGGDGKIEASHSDYDKPLDVEWLCRPCHMRKDGLA